MGVYWSDCTMAQIQKIKKRNGEIVDFQPEKITIAVKKAFAAVLGDAHDMDATDITRIVADAVDTKFGNTLLLPTVEEIQDLVENAIAERGYFTVAKAYLFTATSMKRSAKSKSRK